MGGYKLRQELAIQTPGCPLNYDFVMECQWRWQVRYKTVLIRKVMNFTEKDSCRLVLTGWEVMLHKLNFIVWEVMLTLAAQGSLAAHSGIKFSLWYYFWWMISRLKTDVMRSMTKPWSYQFVWVVFLHFLLLLLVLLLKHSQTDFRTSTHLPYYAEASWPHFRKKLKFKSELWMTYINE